MEGRLGINIRRGLSQNEQIGGDGQGQPPRKKRRTMPSMIITTGVTSDVFKFQWKIENFSAIRHNKKMLQAQQITVTLGAPVGVPCNWTFSLNSETEIVPGAVLPSGALNAPPGSNAGETVEWLEIMRKLVRVPQENDEICNSCSLKIKDKNKKTFFKGYGSVNNLKLNGYRTFKKVLKMTDKSAVLPLVDGALVIDITVTTYASRDLSSHNAAALAEFNKKSCLKFAADMTKMIAPNGQSTFSDIKIISKDGKEFQAHRSVLAGRNPVFQAMFASNLSEHRSGVIQVNDLGGKALGVLLNYIYGGLIKEEWFQSDVIVEMTYAAGKYQLTEVLEFLDNVLGTRGQGTNAGALLALCEKLSLKKAEKELLSYIKKHAVPSATNFAELSAIFENSIGGLD